MRRPDWYVKQVRERTSIANYAGKRLKWDRKSRPQAGDYWAPCPFHTEKSASFHVLDRQGIFKCFGCGESGDVFTLCQKLEGLSFTEAIDKLGSEAGLTPPEASPGERIATDRRGRLFKVMARADALYRKALRGPEGRAARDYLQKRDLGPEVWDQFGIGLAPEGWTWITDALTGEGFTREDIIAAGLAKEGGRSGVIDHFRNRVLFPISDTQGRVIAFGGRALAKDEMAKYVNSPETEIFHKGQTLYRLKEARELLAKTKGAGLVISEGYLDVAAFERAGIASVAPLGTALTEDQLQLAWRAGAEPILCFDGDAAGLRAADRALEVALPHLSPERTVRIAVLPPGLDPDDVFRKEGAAALAGMLERARPAVEALLDREKARRALDTPEARADLKRRLNEAAGRIADPETKKQYQRTLNDAVWTLFGPASRPPAPPKGKGKGPWQPKRPPEARATEELKRHALLPQDRQVEYMVRQPVDYPFILTHGADLFARLPIEDRELDAIRHAILDLWRDAKTVDREALSHHLLAAGWDTAYARVSQWPPPMGRKAMGDKAAAKEKSSGAPPAGASGTADIGIDEPVSPAEKAMRDEIEADWMALLAHDVTVPIVTDEYNEMRSANFDDDDAAFAAAQALLRSQRVVRETAISRARDGEAPTETPRPDAA